jgi:hypothetical protein
MRGNDDGLEVEFTQPFEQTYEPRFVPRTSLRRLGVS